jgi:hypothetical protein
MFLMPNSVNPHNQLQKELLVCVVQKLIASGGLSIRSVSGIRKSEVRRRFISKLLKKENSGPQQRPSAQSTAGFKRMLVQ